ncbi:conserved hypothetical protein [Hyella patelloides LEGE 07179]|uniref:Uncharacterized protein n=1 Tax=Hyella patelloides LEGE 07179 TaxID=945734 RepID=A0A563VTX3_9CYAN|nr:hypothetical protein [Hyella patelloides]VEP14888.1 conserved hypothetical protein [Hyella patelloides LEGE 07179]VEP14897.1 conserved hypothetical protein [Hyella patelloides LEGE 07179]
MAISLNSIDYEVFKRLEHRKNDLGNWQGKASEISDYVATWGILRFWALSFKKDEENSSKVSYFAWQVAREVLCQIIDDSWGIDKDTLINEFNEKLYNDDPNLLNVQTQRQMVIAELLIEIGDTVQFWTNRFKDSQKKNT